VISKTDVLIASHQGRDSGICEDIFDKHGCRPTIVVFSDDYHQFDTQKTTSRYVLTTRSDSNIHFYFDQQGSTVW